MNICVKISESANRERRCRSNNISIDIRFGYRSTMMSSSVVENVLFLFILFPNLQKGLFNVHPMGEGEENGVCNQPTFDFYEM